MAIVLKSNLTSVKKFYFLEYFYILLKCISLYSDEKKIFNMFLDLKEQFHLGESRYKKITKDNENITNTKTIRYFYTFSQVVDEAIAYDIIQKKNYKYYIKKKGSELIDIFESKGSIEFKKALFPLIEKKYNAIYYLVNFCYESNKNKGGLLIFPIYSPLKLGFNRNQIKKSKDIFDYINILAKKLILDMREYLDIVVNLKNEIDVLITKLVDSRLIFPNLNEEFNSKHYNSILKKVRDYWFEYFLKKQYNYLYSLESFEKWAYRAKQIGIIHATEFFPNFNGKILYPTSIILENCVSKDFEFLYEYKNNFKLFIHNPKWNTENQEIFIKSLTDVYFSIQNQSKTYFVNLYDVKELVCYKMKIPEFIFDSFLNKSYTLSISGQVKINISLEADKLPEETNAIYLKREPIYIKNTFKNIIAIDLTKRSK